MKSFNVRISGTSPLLQHRFSDEASVESTTRKVVVNRGTPRDQAERVCYRFLDGSGFYFPSVAICRAIAEAGSNHKLRGSRRSARFVVPAAILVVGEFILIDDHKGKPAIDFDVDSRPVTIPATKGRIMRHRPRFDAWSAAFVLRVNDAILDPSFIKQLLDEAGMTVGIGDFRPQKGGPFGTFTVTKWEEVS